MDVLRLFGVNIVVNADDCDLQKGSSVDDDDDSTISDAMKVYNPVPLRCFPPNITINVQDGSNLDDDDRDRVLDTPLSSKNDSSSRSSTVDDQHHHDINRRKRKSRKDEDVGEGRGRRRRRRRRLPGGEDLGPEPSVDEIFPGLRQRIMESGNGSTSPELLYKKMLQDSDVVKQQNRLLICQEGQRKFSSFFTPDEATIVDDTKEGIQVVAILPRRQNPYNLRLKRWNEKKIMVLNCGWSKLVSESNAKIEDIVQIWGFRENGKLGLAINFVNNNNHKSCSSNIGEGTSKVG